MISPNTANAAAEAIRRGHRAGMGTPAMPGTHDDDDACEELARRVQAEGQVPEAVRYSADQDTTVTGPGGTPSITIALTAEISGEWVTPEIIADTARALASTLSVRLGDVIAEIEGRKM